MTPYLLKHWHFEVYVLKWCNQVMSLVLICTYDTGQILASLFHKVRGVAWWIKWEELLDEYLRISKHFKVRHLCIHRHIHRNNQSLIFNHVIGTTLSKWEGKWQDLSFRYNKYNPSFGSILSYYTIKIDFPCLWHFNEQDVLIRQVLREISFTGNMMISKKNI